MAAVGVLALAAPAQAQRRGGNNGGPGMTNHGGMTHPGNFRGGNFRGGHFYGNRYYHGGRFYGSGVNFYVGGFGYPYYFGGRFYYGYPYGYAYVPYGYPAYTYDPQGVYEGRVVNPTTTTRKTTREVDPKDQSSNVEARVQQQLAQSGYYHGPIDGVVGEETRRAIRSYERANGLHVDGRIDDQLLSTMGLG